MSSCVYLCVSVVFVRENPILGSRIVSYALYVRFGYIVFVWGGNPQFVIAFSLISISFFMHPVGVWYDPIVLYGFVTPAL